MRRVLFISAMFPPEGGGGVQRAAKLVKYLPQYGWAPLVLATRIRARRARDETLVDDMPEGTRTLRTKLALSTRAYDATLGRPQARELYDRVVRQALLSDPGFADVPELVTRGLVEAHVQPVDAVLATSSPFSSVLAGARIARVLGVPLVADMRDPWARNPFVAARSPLHRRAMEAIEDHTLGAAAAVVTVVEGLRPALPAARELLIIPNGFDDEDLAVPPEPCPAHIFRVAYTGSLYGPRASRVWLDALGDARRRVRETGRTLELAAAGQFAALERLLGPIGVQVDVRGYASHPATVALIKSAAVILVLISTDPALRHATSAKLYEAIAAGPPVVAWARDDGECASVLRSTGAGWSAETTADLRALIESVATGERTAAPLADRAPLLKKYQRRTIAEQMAGLLDRVTR